jgi:NAD(P)H-dependent FMN reductase
MKSPRLAMIYGSVRPGRFCDTIAAWAAAEIENDDGFALDTIDPAIDWPAIDEARIRETLAQADAFLIVTPEYNHSFPGALKIVIDAAVKEWAAKPVGFVSYGGVSGGVRAVEHLRGVFAELHAVTVRHSVSFQNPWELFGDHGRLAESERYRRSMATLLQQLGWWTRALRAGRQAESYGAAA